jgi:hypothetical protein
MKSKKIISKTKSVLASDENWFMFVSGLGHHLFSDYIQLRLCYKLEPLTLISSNFVNMVEVVEKAFKLYLCLKYKPDNALSKMSDEYGHNLSKMRESATQFNDIFDSEDIKQFVEPFSDKQGQLYQKLRYGSQKTISGFSTRLSTLMPIVDKIIFTCILDHEENDKKMVNYSSSLYLLLTGSRFDQTKNKELIIAMLKKDNNFIEDYISYCLCLKVEQDKIEEAIKKLT